LEAVFPEQLELWFNKTTTPELAAAGIEKRMSLHDRFTFFLVLTLLGAAQPIWIGQDHAINSYI
jgi:hypothetical protein